MPKTRSTFRVVAPAAAALLVVLAAAVAAARACPSGPLVTKAGPVYSVVFGGHHYTFDAVWRTERAWTRALPGSPWIPAPAAPWLEEFRGALLRNRGVSSLDDLPREAQGEMASLRNLGYL